MPGNGDIKQKIVLDGEKEYSAALRNAQRNLKTLRSELKAETAELGANATAQQKNEVKAKSLQKQIKEQEKVVQTYRKALAEVKDKYSDNEDAIARWEQKLNDARTSLANMKNQLEQTGDSFKSIQTGAKQSVVENTALALSFGKIADAAESMSSKIESVFSGIVGTLKNTIGAVWSELMDIAAKSDNYLDLASFLGASATDVQKWDRAMRAAHGDLSSITSMISRLKYGGKSDSVTEWFGISGENYTNDLEYAEAVLNKMAEDKEAMVANGTWDDAMGDIFGAKKVQEIDSILSDWDEIKRNLKEFDVDNGGVGMTEDEIQTMSELYAQVGLLQEKWNAFKESVATRIFGKIALDITSNFQGALDALIAFMDADTQEERDNAIEDFKKNIEEAFTKIGEAITAAGEALDEAGKGLQGSENGYVKLLGDILSTVGSVLQWLADPNNVQLVEAAFTALFAIWAGTKAMEFVSTLKSVSGYITNIFKNRKAPTIDFGNNGGTGDGGTGTGAQHITTQSIDTSHVTTMYVQNMIGGNGNIPTTPSNPFNGYVPPAIGTGDATGLLTAAGAANLAAAQNAALTGGNTPALSGEAQRVLSGGGNVLYLGDGDVTIGGEVVEASVQGAVEDILGKASGTLATEALRTSISESATGAMAVQVADILTSPAAIAGIATLVGYPIISELGETFREAQWERDLANDPNYRSASRDVQTWMEGGFGFESAKANAELFGAFGTSLIPVFTDMLNSGAIDQSTYEKISKAAWRNASVWGDSGPIPEGGNAGAAIMDAYDWLHQGWYDDLPKFWDWVMNRAEELAAETDKKVLEGTYEDAPENDYHSQPDDYGYFGDDWSIQDILDYYGIGGKNGGGISGALDNMNTLPGQMKEAVKTGMSGVQVYMSGEAVGRLVAPYVSEQIARDMA